MSLVDGMMLVLASASPRRAELLRQAGIQFEVITSHAEEVQSSTLPVAELCQLNARAKALAVARLHPERLVLGADTLVTLDGIPCGKPRDRAEAVAMLEHLQGKTHQVITGVALLWPKRKIEDVFHTVTEVTFKPLDRQTIERYQSWVNPLDKAGAYGIQEHGEMIVEGVVGSLSNVIGLPIEDLKQHLANLVK